MWEFLKVGGPVMVLLVLTSIVSLTFIIERGLALRWSKVVPPQIEDALNNYRPGEDISRLKEICQMQPSPLSRLLLVAHDHMGWPKAENADSVETRARHEVVQLERGIVILEIVVGIAPLLGLVGTIHGLMTLFGSLGAAGLADNSILAKGIGEVLNTTFAGLLIAVPSLIAWSYYSKKVETLAVEMETLCDQFLRQLYRQREKRER